MASSRAGIFLQTSIVAFLLPTSAALLLTWRDVGQHDTTLGIHEDRITTLESPELLVQVAQAQTKLDALEATAAQTVENASEIRAQGVKLEALEGKIDDTHEDVKEILRRLPLPVPRAAPQPVSVAPQPTTPGAFG